MAVTYYTEEEFNEVQVMNERLKRLCEGYEASRPQWAMGYSSDSIAAQSSSAALQQIWTLIGATNQTQAMCLLRELVK